MKMTFLLDLKAMSGHPGRSLQWIRYRYPIPKSSRRTVRSGEVSLERMRAITSLRLSGSGLLSVELRLIAANVEHRATVADGRCRPLPLSPT